MSPAEDSTSAMAGVKGERRAETKGGKMRFSLRALKVLVVLWVVAVLAASCGGSDPVDESGAVQPTVAEVDADDDPDADPEPAAPTEMPEATVAPEPEPQPTEAPEPEVVFWADALSVGDCFNRSTLTGDFGEVPEPIPCDELHEEEVYAVGLLTDGPDVPFPGEDVIAEQASEELCAEATINFAGRPFEELPFNAGVLFPTEDEWEAGDRGILCSAGSNVPGRLKIGSAAAGTLAPDAQLVVRTSLSHPSVGEFEDWLLIDRSSTQLDALSLTGGTFDLQLRRASATSEGIVFDATLLGAEGFATAINTIDLTTGDLGEIAVPAEGFEYSGTIGKGTSLVFAARESDDADWNLFGITAGGSAVAIGDSDLDEHYPTLSADGDVVVFHRGGDLWRSDIDGTNQIQLTATDANEWESEISPDGQWIAFVSDRGGSDDLWLMTIDGEDLTQLTDHPADDIWPTWSADGSTIFFASDRFAPEDNKTVIMAIQVGDDQASYFSTFNDVSHPLVMESALAAAAMDVFPTLDARYADSTDEVVSGEPGTLTLWEHSSGLLAAELPAGWSVFEESGFGLAAVHAAPDLDEYFDFWAADGIKISLHEAADTDTFVADVFSSAAAVVSGCTEVDNTGGVELDGDFAVTGVIYECDTGSNVNVLGVFNTTTGRGVLLEGQRDNVPDADTDEELLTAIALSVVFN